MYLKYLMSLLSLIGPMSGKNRRLVADQPVEFAKSPVEVQDFMKFTVHLEESMEYTLNE